MTEQTKEAFAAEEFYKARDGFNPINGASIAAWQKQVDLAQSNGFEVECPDGDAAERVAGAVLKKDGKAISDGKPKAPAPAPAAAPEAPKAEDKSQKK